MKLGIKIGLRGDSPTDIRTTKPDFCEIWFHSAKIDQYDYLFNAVKQVGGEVGLHFWGALPDGTLANFAYPNKEVLEFSRTLMRRTIEAAAKHKAVYVNLHPSGLLLTKVDFEHELFTPLTEAAPLSAILETLQESLTQFGTLANDNGIILTVESTPLHALGHPWHGTEGRLKPTNIGEVTVPNLEKIFPIPHVYFANDFGHSAATIISENRTEVTEAVFNIARRLAPITKLLHVSYIIAPYNGTDYHGCLYFDEFKTSNAVPSYSEMKQLLNLFVHRDDVYALVEPESDHIGNFAFLKKLVQDTQNSLKNKPL